MVTGPTCLTTIHPSSVLYHPRLGDVFPVQFQCVYTIGGMFNFQLLC